MSIGRPDETFILTEQVDGAILLEPAITMTTGEARILTDARIQERIAKARKGEGLVRRTSRRI
jgi:hypothetical protein